MQPLRRRVRGFANLGSSFRGGNIMKPVYIEKRIGISAWNISWGSPAFVFPGLFVGMAFNRKHHEFFRAGTGCYLRLLRPHLLQAYHATRAHHSIAGDVCAGKSRARSDNDGDDHGRCAWMHAILLGEREKVAGALLRCGKKNLSGQASGRNPAAVAAPTTTDGANGASRRHSSR